MGNTTETKNDSIITLIFKQRTFKKDTLVSAIGSKSLKTNTLYYTVKDEFVERELPKRNLNKTDTLKISTKKDVIIFHGYHFYHHSYYIFKPGDIVVFDYKNDAPYCSIINRNEKSDINYFVDYNIKSEIIEDENIFFLNNKRFLTDIEKKDFRLKNIEVLKKYSKDLKDIYNQKKISKEYFDIYNEDYNYILKKIEENENSDNSILLQDINLSLPFNRLLVIEHFNKIFPPVLIKEKFGSHFDDKKQFDNVLMSKEISEKNKAFLLYHYFNDLLQYSNVSDINEYFEKLKKSSLGENLIEELEGKYLINLAELKKNTDEVILINPKKIKSKLETFINENKGKVIYVDFWASWCAPCRELMPSSHQLQQYYKNKNVKFLYLSIDRNFDAWQKAMQNEELPYKDSYLCVNYPEANFYRDLQLKSIPRYLIYNKKGELINSNAPSPDSKEIRIELNKYLSE
ncbi:TlpA disulfide reductase family protein [Flavobacterium sp. J27]|uniref:TlpA family protein disulfide reductase n=1 Tax=Flavobacterium sp. J27 TaxID=2060419 RepID=UPI001031FE75|nr:TlpA disulfide reductase family protein [Flavobacterium sp. J27]